VRQIGSLAKQGFSKRVLFLRNHCQRWKIALILVWPSDFQALLHCFRHSPARFSIALLISMGLPRYLWLADLANFTRAHLLVAGIAIFVVGLALPRRSTKVSGAARLSIS
jgi:hypothetical protein